MGARMVKFVEVDGQRVDLGLRRVDVGLGGLHLLLEGVDARGQIVGRRLRDGSGIGEALLAIALQDDLGELGLRRGHSRASGGDARLGAGDEGALVGRIQLDEHLPGLHVVALLDVHPRHAPQDFDGDVDLHLGDDVAGRREAHLRLRGRDHDDLGQRHLGLEELRRQRRGEHAPRSEGDAPDRRQRDDPAQRLARARRAGSGAVDAQGGEVRGDAIIHGEAGGSIARSGRVPSPENRGETPSKPWRGTD